MTLSPIPRVLSTFRSNEVQALLMGGQACILYGAAEFSRDADFAILSSPENLDRLRRASRQATRKARGRRPAAAHAIAGDLPGVEAELAREEERERKLDRAYWAPLRAELEEMRPQRR